MALEGNVRVLSRVPLFSGFGAEELRLLAFAAEPVSLRAGQTACREGEKADGALVLVSGVLAHVADGRTLARIADAGTLVCETALVTETVFPLTLAADEASVLLKLPRDRFRRLMDDFPAAADSLRRHFARNLDDLTSRLEAAAARMA
jgi:CRP-like cAMP-binding protein